MKTFLDVYRHRFILQNLIAKNLKANYRNMALGFFWSVLNPVVLVAVMTTAWLLFLGARPTFPAMVLVAMIPHNLFVYCMGSCTASFRDNGSLVKKVAFPRQILPLASIGTHLIHFGVQFGLVLVALLFLPHPGHALGVHLLWLPLVIGVQVALCIGAGLLVSALNVVYRDVQYLVESGLLVLFWFTPIVYESLPAMATRSWWARVYYLNPMAGIVEAYRNVLYHGTAPDAVSFGFAVLVTLLIGAFGVRKFWVHERSFGDLL